jgi:predicted enzyme related to lactoylglutathione lyase
MTIDHKPGDICWADLSTSNLEGAKELYGRLLGWTFGPTFEEMAGYTQAYKNGAPVVGLFHLDANMPTSVWNIYFASDDIHKTQSIVESNGGTILAPAMAVEDLGSMMVASDPTGAVFGVWQKDTFGGAELFNDPGSLTWEDLRTTDPARAQAFYTAVFGYRYDELPMEVPEEYKTFAHPDGEQPLGGIGGFVGGAASSQSHWLAYFRVDDTPAAMNVITEAGGKLVSSEMETQFGRQAVVSDPWGGTFCLIDNEVME